MEGTKNPWLTTGDIAERWHCTSQTVVRRMKVAEAEPVLLGRNYHWRLSQVLDAERSLNIAGLFDAYADPSAAERIAVLEAEVAALKEQLGVAS